MTFFCANNGDTIIRETSKNNRRMGIVGCINSELMEFHLPCLKLSLILLKPRIQLNFSHRFAGTIWNSALSSSEGILVLEVRDGEARKTTFSALEMNRGRMLWRDLLLEEPWWIGLDAARGWVALFSMYTDTANPDRKSLIAYHLTEKKILWWRNDFSLTKIGQDCLSGTSTQLGHREVTVELSTGVETEFVPQREVDPVLKPSQYAEGHAYFSTVKTFLQTRFNLSAVVSLEYLEAFSVICISCYTRDEQGLINDLLVLSTEGELLLRENLGEHLKGIGQDTFFIYDGSVIFVKNRGELFSYKIV